MRSRRCGWLAGLAATILFVAAAIAPALHARMVRGAVMAQASHAAAHEAHTRGTRAHGAHAHRGHSGGQGGPPGGHVAESSCFACLIVAAPGLPARSAGPGQSRSRRRPIRRIALEGVGATGQVWPPQRARAPPLSL